MNISPIDPEHLARMLGGTLTSSEWERLRATISEQTIREILDEDARLRSIMHSIASSKSNPENVQRIMTVVMNATAPNSTLVRVTKLVPYLGVALSLLGIIGVLFTGYVAPPTELNVRIPTLDHEHALWAVAAVVLFGVGVWHMESA